MGRCRTPCMVVGCEHWWSFLMVGVVVGQGVQKLLQGQIDSRFDLLPSPSYSQPLPPVRMKWAGFSSCLRNLRDHDHSDLTYRACSELAETNEP